MKSLGVLSSSTVRKETSSSVASKQPIVEDVKDKKMPTVIVFDLETTGLSKERDRIVEIACVDCPTWRRWREMEQISKIFKP